jgi:hypothetical protein
MLDFNSKSALSDRINYLIDGAFTQETQRREYLGASIVGHVCERHVQYHLMAARGMVERKEFPARILRIFDRGNLYEERARDWLKAAGILFGRTAKGKSFSDFGGQFRGHVDGVITGWKHPDVLCPFDLPALWEHKCLGAKNWKKLCNDKLKDYSSTYYIQTQIYMHYLDLKRCLFMATNADTMEIYHEIIPYQAAEAASAVDRVKRVLAATDAGEMVPRMTTDPAFYQCRWCDFRGGCWA